MIDTTEAVRLAAEALWAHHYGEPGQMPKGYGWTCDNCGESDGRIAWSSPTTETWLCARCVTEVRGALAAEATAAVTAALPALVEQFAALLDHEALQVLTDDAAGSIEQAALRAAARLVREAAEVTG